MTAQLHTDCRRTVQYVLQTASFSFSILIFIKRWVAKQLDGSAIRQISGFEFIHPQKSLNGLPAKQILYKKVTSFREFSSFSNFFCSYDAVFHIGGRQVSIFETDGRFFFLQVPTPEGVVYSVDEGRTRFYDLLQLVEFYQLNAGTLPTRYVSILSHNIVTFLLALI